MALNIAKVELDKLRLHGEECYATECCGVLLGNISEDGVKHAYSAVRCVNTRHELAQAFYNIDPIELRRVERDAKRQGHEIVGFYHSHPDWPARWSQNDLEEASWAGCSYVITRVQKGRAMESNSFGLVVEEENKHFEAEEIEVNA
jgi:proteasome lid subunit RPN8/RPN11